MNDFEKLVSEMRDAQKKYFRTRSPESLRAAKAAEKDVDDMLLRIEHEKQQMEFNFEQSNKTGEEK